MVSGEENLNDVRGSTGAFVIEADYDDSTSTMWVSQKPPYYLRLLVAFRDGRYQFTLDRI
jgi:hypothetical protein